MKTEKQKEETLQITSENINGYIDSYYQGKKDEKTIKDTNEKIGAGIKKYLVDNKLTEYSGENHKVSITTSEQVSYDDTTLLKLAKDLPQDIQDELIDKIEIVNLDKLERLLIENKVSAEQFKDAEVVKTTVKLYVK